MPEIVDLGAEAPEEDLEVIESPDPQSVVESRNRALIDEIHALGAQVPPLLLQQVQLDMLIDFVYPQGTPTRKLFDLMIEDRLTDVLEHVKQQVVRDRLNPLKG